MIIYFLTLVTKNLPVKFSQP
ncbi:hypothetical protein NITGR_190002 [Nitrospina gracilis 3/211]|uniref:Uncharacterized protein n=1 Tax=Nitrospina gracilis (strain 3/211) TaxID=1266370 RepID=M1Z9N6_NITG3|nr:hypothetical protein NITGR_190002 [Nitrospina gracilis 3/211]